MNENNNISTLSLAVLGLIAQKPHSGYDLRKVFSTTPLGHFSPSPGAIYPALQRIEKSGWVRGSINNKKTLRPKMIYRITKRGKEVLKKHLLQAVTRDDVIWRMDDLKLRFSFMDNVVGRKKTLQFLKEFIVEVESYHRSLQQYLQEVKGDISTCGRLAMENGIETYKMNAKWIKRAIKELGRD
ncbi:MAG: PadR family transcriptional regulator [Planctomycetes bacterium]|nr:PadR family transcriptional regulator [Planctomycetota bacterium]